MTLDSIILKINNTHEHIHNFDIKALNYNSKDLCFDNKDIEYNIKKENLLNTLDKLHDNLCVIGTYINNIKKEIDNNERLIIIKNCKHDYKIGIPSGPRDNGDYWYECNKCGTIK